MKTITVIIPTFNRLQKLKQLLGSLDRQTLSKEHFSVMVADDGSVDGTVEYLGAAGIPFVTQPHRGPAAARNAGAAGVSTPFLLFVDDDAVPRKDWIKAAYDAVVGTKGVLAAEEDVIRTGENLPLSHSVGHQGPGGMLTCNLLVLRELFERAGRFNERFLYPMNEDFDFFLRLKALTPVHYLANMAVEHPVYPLPFFRTLVDSMAYARRRVYSEHLLYELHPQEFRQVKAAPTAKASIRRLSTRYIISNGFANKKALFKRPVSGALWLAVCAARQASFLFLRVRGYRG